MARIEISGDALELHLDAIEKAESVHGSLRAKLRCVQAVEALDDAIGAVRGLKLPGARWPGKFAVGTFIDGTEHTFAVVHHDVHTGVRVRLSEGPYTQWIVGSAEHLALAQRINDALG